MSHGRFWRPRRRLCGVALATALAVTGCFADENGAGDEAAGDGTASPQSTAEKQPGKQGGKQGAGPPAAPDGGARVGARGDDPSDGPFEPDPERLPKTRDEALRLARKVAAKPENWGAGFERGTPYESGPDRASELGGNCVWEQRPVRSSELAGFTRRSVLPAKDGNGPLRVAAVVTVHRDVESARREMARTLEEALRCPDQQLSSTERVTGLITGGVFAREAIAADDAVLELGKIHSDELGGPHDYIWQVQRYGPITIGILAKGSEGHDRKEINLVNSHGNASMQVAVQLETGALK